MAFERTIQGKHELKWLDCGGNISGDLAKILRLL